MVVVYSVLKQVFPWLLSGGLHDASQPQPQDVILNFPDVRKKQNLPHIRPGLTAVCDCAFQMMYLFHMFVSSQALPAGDGPFNLLFCRRRSTKLIQEHMKSFML